MKGLLYAALIQSKRFFCRGAVAAVLCAAFAILLNYAFRNAPNEAVLAYLPLILSFPVLCVFIDWPVADLNQNRISGFVGYALASGISRNTFVLTELVKNLLAVAFSMAFLAPMLLAEHLAGLTINGEIFWDIFVMIVALNLCNWHTALLTLYLKKLSSAAIISASVLWLLLLLQIFCYRGDAGSGYEIWISNLSAISGPACLVVFAFVYAIIYLLFLRRLKRGDIY